MAGHASTPRVGHSRCRDALAKPGLTCGVVHPDFLPACHRHTWTNAEHVREAIRRLEDRLVELEREEQDA